MFFRQAGSGNTGTSTATPKTATRTTAFKETDVWVGLAFVIIAILIYYYL